MLLFASDPYEHDRDDRVVRVAVPGSGGALSAVRSREASAWTSPAFTSGFLAAYSSSSLLLVFLEQRLDLHIDLIIHLDLPPDRPFRALLEQKLHDVPLFSWFVCQADSDLQRGQAIRIARIARHGQVHIGSPVPQQGLHDIGTARGHRDMQRRA